MPKEAKKRGRRAEKKRKGEKEAEEVQKVEEHTQNIAPLTGDYQPQEEGYYGDGAHLEDSQFYGLLTDSEAEYFRNADEVLETNQFHSADERNLFITNVYREADGKELKIANSQGCSRLLEKLILLSTPVQLKKLWRVFSGHFLNLVQHRFASHCCEVLFERSVVVASRELSSDYVAAHDETAIDEVFASMESLFLYMLNELGPHIKALLTHRFASHPLRALLLLLSGQPPAASASLVQSRKKKNISITSDFAPPEERDSAATIDVPQSFQDAIDKILAAASAELSAEETRAMAVHQIGGPTLQVLLQLEMRGSGEDRKQRVKNEGSFLDKLTGISAVAGGGEKEEEEEGAGSSSFFSNLLYDPVGSHLAERIMGYAPKREFKKLYKAHFRMRMGSLARNETAGFVVMRVLEKLNKEVLQEAVEEILPQVKGVIERSQVAVIKTLIDCCAKQEIEAGGIAKAVAGAYDCSSEQLIFKMLNLTPEDLTPKEPAEGKEPPRAKRNPKQRHGSLLAQSMLQLPGEFHRMICESLLAQPPTTIINLSQHPQGSHVVQALLLSPISTTPDKRKLLNLLRGASVTLALHPAGSHIVDAAWAATNCLMNYKQSIAAELLAGERDIRESFFGRTVWRNWSMDKYKTRRNEWFNLAKEAAVSSGVGALRLDNIGSNGGVENTKGQQGNQGRKKTALELARERHGSAKRAADGQPTTGANSLAPKKRQRAG